MDKDEEWYWKVLGVIGMAFLVFLLGVIGSVVRGCWTASSGKVDFCYIETLTGTVGNSVRTADNPLYELHGHVDYQPNFTIGIFQSFDQAVQAAGKIDCPLHVK